MKAYIYFLNDYYRVLLVWSNGQVNYHKVCKSKDAAIEAAKSQAKFYGGEYCGEYEGARY